MEITAAVLYGVGEKLKVEALELAPPQAGEVLIKMEAAGVCHSDYHVVTGHERTNTPTHQHTNHQSPITPTHQHTNTPITNHQYTYKW